MRKLWLGAVLGLAILTIAIVSAATADRNEGEGLRAKLDGFSETPAVSTAAKGKFRAEIDGNEIHYRLKYAGLEAPVRFAHIHFGQEDVSGGVAAFLCGGGSKPACPQSGTVTGTVRGTDIEGPAAQGIAAAQGGAPGEIDELIHAMKSGVTYANIHSDKFPMGEIRGQIEGEDEDEE